MLCVYLIDEIVFEVVCFGFMLWMVDNFVDGGGLFLFVLCYEDDVLLIVLIYGYGDVVCGYDV